MRWRWLGALEPIPEHSAQLSNARLLDFYRRDLRQPEGSRSKPDEAGIFRVSEPETQLFRRATCGFRGKSPANPPPHPDSDP